jgi:hypothetical protein
VPGYLPAAHAVPTQQSAFYVVLTTLRPDSGMVFGSVRAVAEAELVRLLEGPTTRGALVAAYVRLAHALVHVDVETTTLPAPGGVARYRVRTWLEEQLISQQELEIPLRRE